MALFAFVRRLLRVEIAGTSTVEYGLILGLIVLAMLFALGQIADESTEMWDMVSEETSEAMSGAS